VVLGLHEEEVITPLWDFEGINEARRELLMAPFQFDDLVAVIKSEVRNVRFKKETRSHEAKGSWRPAFWFDVGMSTFDRFFNSPYGYRGQYFACPENGLRKNALLITSLIDVLLVAVAGDPKVCSEIHRSLTSTHAKIWIEESQHDPRTPDLIVEIRVAEWERFARAIRERLDAGDSSLTAKEVDRIYGARAPVGTTLKVMGAWVAQNGELNAVPLKLHRAEEIKAYGLS
jgi:hypothetical protein